SVVWSPCTGCRPRLRAIAWIRDSLHSPITRNPAHQDLRRRRARSPRYPRCAVRPSTDELGSSTDSTETSPGEPDLTSEPTRLDRYVLLEKIGRGSFATVWAAYDPQLDRRVAIKLLRPR